MTNQELMILENLLNRIEQCEKVQTTVVESLRALTDAYNLMHNELNWFDNNCIYEIADSLSRKLPNSIPKILSYDETMYEIKENKKSISRFGDAEFGCILGGFRAKYTTSCSKEFADRLKEVLHSSLEGHLVAIADNYGSLEKYTEQSKREIRAYMTDEIRSKHGQLLEPNRTYYNAYITRPYMMFKDKQIAKRRFDDFKSIWADKNCIVIEGYETRLGVNNDLFDSCKSIKRILAPSVDAYIKYDEILSASKNQSRDALYIIALGPTASVLSYDLAADGRWAIDVGHIDIEYEWFLKGCDIRTEVKGKYNNEVPGGENVEEICNEQYEKQIIKRI